MRVARPASLWDREGEDDPSLREQTVILAPGIRVGRASERSIASPDEMSSADNERKRLSNLDAAGGSDQESGIPEINRLFPRRAGTGQDREANRSRKSVKAEFFRGDITTRIGPFHRGSLGRPRLRCGRWLRAAFAARGFLANILNAVRDDLTNRRRRLDFARRSLRGRCLATSTNRRTIADNLGHRAGSRGDTRSQQCTEERRQGDPGAS